MEQNYGTYRGKTWEHYKSQASKLAASGDALELADGARLERFSDGDFHAFGKVVGSGWSREIHTDRGIFHTIRNTGWFPGPLPDDAETEA